MEAYYIYLIDILEKGYEGNEIYDNFKRKSRDFKKIIELFRDNYILFSEHLQIFDIYLLKKDLQNDFLNLNEYERIFASLYVNQLEEFIPLLVKSPHFRFKNFPYYDHPEFLDIIFDTKKTDNAFIKTMLYSILENFPTKDILIKVLFNVNEDQIVQTLFKYISERRVTTEKATFLFLDIAIAKGVTINFIKNHDLFVGKSLIEPKQEMAEFIKRYINTYTHTKTLTQILEEFIKTPAYLFKEFD